MTPKAVLSWQPDRDNFVVRQRLERLPAGRSQCQPSASICDSSLTALGISQVPGQYSSDNLWSYEIGSKNTFFDHTPADQCEPLLHRLEQHPAERVLAVLRRAIHRQSRQGEERGRRHRDRVPADHRADLRPDRGLHRRPVDEDLLCRRARLQRRLSCLLVPVPGRSRRGRSPPPAMRCSVRPGLSRPPAEYHFPEWAGRTPYFRARLSALHRAKIAASGTGLEQCAHSIPRCRGPPVLNNLSLRAGLALQWSRSFGVREQRDQLTSAYVRMRATSLRYAGPPGTGATQLGPTTDDLYFARGVRPRTIGITATYRY